MSAWLVRVVRHPATRWVGLAVGLVALAFFVRTVASTTDGGTAWVRYDALDLAVGVASFTVFEVLAVVSLHLLGGVPADRIWAVSQLVKYLPVPASAALGMTGESIRQGHDPRRAVRLLVDHSVLLIGAATLIGVPSVADIADRWVGLPWWLTAAATAAVGVVAVVFATRGHPVGRRVAMTATALGAWVAGAAGLAAAFSLGPGGPSLLALTSAFAAAWVAGQIVVPVPAGLGVREVALVGLVAAASPDVAAFALATRVAQIGAEGVFFVGVLGRVRFGSPAR